MSRVAPPPSVSINPFEPVLGAMASGQVLQIIRCRNPLAFSGTKKVPRDWIGVVAEADFDRTFKTMHVAVVARSLVGLMLLHEGQKLFRLPAFGLEVIVVRS